LTIWAVCFPFLIVLGVWCSVLIACFLTVPAITVPIMLPVMLNTTVWGRPNTAIMGFTVSDLILSCFDELFNVN
jgi:hypothetical protein